MPDEDRLAGIGEQLEASTQSDADEGESNGGSSEPSSRSEQGTPNPADVTEAREPVRAGSSFEDTLREQLKAIEDGTLAKNATAYDGDLAALLAALEEDRDQLAATGEQLAEYLDRDVDVEDLNKSGLLSLAARVGLKTAAPETIETLLDAKAEQARQL